jgi:hypothetical protein
MAGSLAGCGQNNGGTGQFAKQRGYRAVDEHRASNTLEWRSESIARDGWTGSASIIRLREKVVRDADRRRLNGGNWNQTYG